MVTIKVLRLKIAIKLFKNFIQKELDEQIQIYEKQINF